MAPQTFAHGLLAQLIEATTTTTLTETPACLPRWKVTHPNGAVLVANTARYRMERRPWSQRATSPLRQPPLWSSGLNRKDAKPSRL